MAHVYKARAPSGEPVCLKLLPEDAPPDEVDMFLDEARLNACFNHPHIARFHGSGLMNGRRYIALELIEGWDLKHVMTQQALTRTPTLWHVAAYIALAVSGALHHAHTATGPDGEPLRVVHRDVGPHNILVSASGDVKLIDFGVARATGRRYQDRQGIILGKPGYMSPEQSWDDPLDGRSDLFSLGVVLHELLTGRPLFHHPPDLDVQGIIVNVRTKPIPSPAPEGAPQALTELARITTRALERDRDERWPSGHAMHQALAAWLAEHSPRRDLKSELARFLRALSG